MISKIYNKEIVDPLSVFDNIHQIKLADEVYAFKKEESSKTLVTACHHGPEIYGTYQAAIDLMINSDHKTTVVPVVDVENFCKNKERSISLVNTDPDFHPALIYDFIKGYKGIKPKKQEWQYGKKDASQSIKDISELVKKSDLIIDIHNSCTYGFMIITAGDQEEYLRELVKQIEEDVYEGDLGPKYKQIEKGIFKCNEPNTIIDFAAKKGITNFVLELPVFYKDGSLRNFDELTKTASSFLEYSINKFMEVN